MELAKAGQDPSAVLELIHELILEHRPELSAGPGATQAPPEEVVVFDWYILQDRRTLADKLGLVPNYLSQIMSGGKKTSRRIRAHLEQIIKQDTGCQRVIWPDTVKKN